MKQLIIQFILLLNFSCANSQYNNISQIKIKEDLNEIINDLAENYVYLQEKNVDLNCIKEKYEKEIPNLKTKDETLLFFEYLLDEFYDSHLILNANTNSSFRLYSPIYVSIKNGKPVVSSVWQSQIESIELNIIGSELLKINGTNIDKAIEQFPTHCNNKKSQKVREWIINKLLAGRYNEPRILTLKLDNKEAVEFDLGNLRIKQSSELLTSTVENDIGIIRINNSLGNNSLINEFDNTLGKLMNTKGLIIDLRNTVDGGNSYVARGIMGRFINEPSPYQKHMVNEQYNGNPIVERSWMEYVSPREERYTKPVVILVGRWTGSMGEGIAIGFDGMKRAQIVGSEMEGLAGEIEGFAFKNQKFGYQLSVSKIFHINGTPREKYLPINYVIQTIIDKDQILEKGIELIKNEMK